MYYKTSIFWIPFKFISGICNYYQTLDVISVVSCDKNLTNLMGKLCCVSERSVQFFMQFFNTFKLHSFLLRGYGVLYSVLGPLGCMGLFRVCGVL